MLTNKAKNSQNSCVIKTTLSDFHKMTVTALGMQIRKLKPRVSFYRDCTKFSNKTFINSLKIKLGTQSISPDEWLFKQNLIWLLLDCCLYDLMVGFLSIDIVAAFEWEVSVKLSLTESWFNVSIKFQVTLELSELSAAFKVNWECR